MAMLNKECGFKSQANKHLNLHRAGMRGEVRGDMQVILAFVDNPKG